MLTRLLAHPLTRGLELDDPQTSVLRVKILEQKPFLRRIFEEWYRRIAAATPEDGGELLELGSGAGFLPQFIPDATTSDVQMLPGIDLRVDAARLPFDDGSLRAIVMINVLHHLPDPQAFFSEAERSLRAGGVVAMVEPWKTSFSSLVYRFLHDEDFEPSAGSWRRESNGPLSQANMALPWIVFVRDRQRFLESHPALRLEMLEPMMPFRYLVSGGLSMRSLMPVWTFNLWRRLEHIVPFRSKLAMFALIVLRRD